MFDVGCADGSDKGCFSVGHGLTVNDFKQQLLQQIPPLRRYARALTGNLDTADDLVQDCLVRAMQREQKFCQGTNLRAWLFTVMHNIFIDQVRSKGRKPTHVPYDAAGQNLSIDGGQLERVELREYEALLQRLPAEQRSVLLLIALEGQSYEHAAAITGVPVGTVKSRLSRARRSLLAWTRLAEEPRSDDDKSHAHTATDPQRVLGG